MKIEKECTCCGAVYKIAFTDLEPDLRDVEYDPNEETFDEESELYPEFCPFCGSHEDEEPPEDLE